MYPIAEVPVNELEELKRQAAEIQRRIELLTPPTSIAGFCKSYPYNLPCFLDHDARKPVTFSKPANSDVWKYFLALGKAIHVKNGVFTQRGKHYPYAPFYVDESKQIIPSKVCELSREEVEISAEMIDRMIEIYNEYMVRLHTQVTFRDEYGALHIIPVVLPESGEK